MPSLLCDVRGGGVYVHVGEFSNLIKLSWSPKGLAWSRVLFFPKHLDPTTTVQREFES